MAEMTPAWATEKPTALLVLADGTVIEGRGLGATGSAVAEVCFNTAFTGYQEILTDPSYRGQIVAMTYPMIGNYGVNEEDVESRRPWVNGFIVKPNELVSERPFITHNIQMTRQAYARTRIEELQEIAASAQDTEKAAS